MSAGGRRRSISTCGCLRWAPFPTTPHTPSAAFGLAAGRLTVEESHRSGSCVQAVPGWRSTPLSSQRCCHVSPGNVDSQSTSLATPRRRAPESSCSRTRTAPRSARRWCLPAFDRCAASTARPAGRQSVRGAACSVRWPGHRWRWRSQGVCAQHVWRSSSQRPPEQHAQRLRVIAGCRRWRIVQFGLPRMVRQHPGDDFLSRRRQVPFRRGQVRVTEYPLHVA